MASSRTEILYDRDGLRLLSRASVRYAEFPIIEALVLESGLPYGLAQATTRRYKPAYRAALNARGPSDGWCQNARDEAYAQICTNLRTRGELEHPLRTAALKIVPTRTEAQLTLNKLGQLVHDGNSRMALTTALFVLVVSKIAIRPVELIGAKVEDGILTVKNAKRRKRQKMTRSISLKRFSDAFIQAVSWLIALAERGVAEYKGEQEDAFELWRNAMASCLARASIAACKKRLSLYVWRHIGIATWKRAGFSAEKIASLAGHLLLSSAERHYAPGSKGLGARHALAEPVGAPESTPYGTLSPRPLEDEALAAQVDLSAVSNTSTPLADTSGIGDNGLIEVKTTSDGAPPPKGSDNDTFGQNGGDQDHDTEIGSFATSAPEDRHDLYDTNITKQAAADALRANLELDRAGISDECAPVTSVTVSSEILTSNELASFFLPMPKPKVPRAAAASENDLFEQYRKKQESSFKRLDESAKGLNLLDNADSASDLDGRRKK